MRSFCATVYNIILRYNNIVMLPLKKEETPIPTFIYLSATYFITY